MKIEQNLKNISNIESNVVSIMRNHLASIKKAKIPIEKASKATDNNNLTYDVFNQYF